MKTPGVTAPGIDSPIAKGHNIMGKKKKPHSVRNVVEIIVRDRLYKRYLETKQWIVKSLTWMAEAEGECENCGALAGRTLQIHHKHYNTLFSESREDVMVLCPKCHFDLHRKQFQPELLPT